MSHGIVPVAAIVPRRTLAVLLTALPVVAVALTPQVAPAAVVSTDPTPYELGVSAALATISITLDQPAPVPGPGAVRVSGLMSGLHSGTASPAGNTIVFQNQSPGFLPGELVHVNLRSDVVAGGYYFAFTIASAPSLPTWTTRAAYPTAQRPYFIHGGDFDGDGNPDVALPNEDSNDVSIFLNAAGTGHFSGHADYGVGLTPSSIFGEDFDNDGDLDLATADITSGTLSVLLNEGDGTFAAADTYPSGTVTRQVHGGDFDGDNDIDLCTTSNMSNEIYLFYNHGDGTFALGVPYTNVGVGPFAIRTGDFDRDGRLDIGVANHSAGTLSILRNTGGTFATTGTFSIGGGPWCLNGNDFDGDGDFDLVSVASSSNRLVLLVNDGNGGFALRRLYTTGGFPLGVFAADLDGDGDVDATSSNFSGQSVNIFLNNGAGILSLDTTLDLPMAGTYTWAHDLDGDGDLDISTVDELADSLFIYPNGDSPAGTDNPAPPPALPELAVWPNPARAGDAVRVRVPSSLAGEELRVEVFAVDGRRVRSQRLGGDRPASSGVQEWVWDGRTDDGRLVSSGTYVIAAIAGERRAVREVHIVR